MVANVSSTPLTPNPKPSSRPPSPSPSKPKRFPLLPSDADNNGPSLPRQRKSREVSSRYLSSTASITTTMTSSSSSTSSFSLSSFSSTNTTSSSNSICTPSRRFPSPLVSSTNLMTPLTTSKRAQSAERRRIVTPLVSSTNKMTPASTVNIKRAQSTERRRPVSSRINETSAAAKMLTAMPVRSLSVSFQGDSVACPASKVSKLNSSGFNNGNRLGTPERKAVTPVVIKLVIPKRNDQQRWPGRSRQESFMTSSVDFTNDNMTLSESKLTTNKLEINRISRSVDMLFSDSDNSDRAVSDAESVCSGSTLGNIRGVGPGALMVPARFREDTVNRLRRVQSGPVSPPLSRNNKLLLVNRYVKDGPGLSPRGLSPSPSRRGFRPASPSKSVTSSPSRGMGMGMSSPTRAWGGMRSNSNVGNTPSILSFAAETRRRKVGDNVVDDAHALRLLHNKYLQWRFVNARADAAMLVQRETAQKILYNSWVATSKIRQSVISKQIEIQQLRQSLKLYTVLKNQIPFLNVWDQVERSHIVSLSEAIVSLESSILCLPLVDGAKVNVQSLKDAIRSAADVMQAMTSLICSLVTKVEHVNKLASELANTTRNECAMIDRCKDLLSMLTQMEVQDCSIRTHILQLQRGQQP